MPSDRNTAYPFLEQMRTEELEALLQQEFTAADGGEPDVDYIMAIMEVMKQRDANPPAAEADVDAAWRDFKENYQGQASAYETEVLPERDSSHLDQITSPSPKKKSRRILRAAVITAACIVILCGAASAFGFDILQAFADWTAETFGFVTPGQEEALSVMLPDLRSGQGKYLLHGVTGSGKTEVFIRLVRQTLVQGKSAMILVPEIALTPQMVMWFRARFGAVAAVLHSRLSAGERFDEWRRIRRGDARVVIGARSAVFAPCGNLGLIVVDEEHESTYISDRHPRYDAREVAIRRCENEHATLLLASATPSILSFARARRGDYVLLEMPSRVGNRPMPQVTLVDMRKEMENGNRSVFSGQLVAALKNCVARGEQAMLLMNRRGYNSFVSCRSCGYVVKCPNCDVAMTYHVVGSGQTEAKLHCHYCGFAALPPNTCPKCGSKYIRYFGAGTQKIEEELKKLFPQENVIRMDIDTTSGKDGHAKLLDEFRSGRAKLLVGTQMIAKGLDFPKVTLVGVIAADMTLNLPDYRARERTFQLLTQVAGRAGRGTLPGQVIIQTYKPEDEVIQTAAAQDYRAFFELEFDRRRTGLYPPFTILARLLVESNSPQKAREVATMLHARCEELLNAHPLWKKRALMVRLDQPSITVLRGKTRWHVLMKLLVHPETEQFAAALSELAREKQEGAEVYFEYNPTTMM